MEGLILLASRYEGVDFRLITRCVDAEISIGDYVLSGGEIPAMALIDALVRQLPHALGNADSVHMESFAVDGLDFPQYTRPPVYKNLVVPDILLSGDHQKIAAWRKQKAKRRTQIYRPDLLDAV